MGVQERGFEVWVPKAGAVVLEVGGVAHPMVRVPDGGKGAEPGAGNRREGWWRVSASAGDGDEYGFRVDGGPLRPDPRAVRLPLGPSGPSAVVEHSRYRWHDAGRPGLALPGRTVYELHIGTFTPEGTFAAAVGRLGHLVELGVDFVELVPVCPFPGRRGWGYDGIAPWAVHEPYGGPEGLKRFVDAAHGVGLGVLLDVVHNHLGPAGNHLPEFGPYFTDRHSTPWGTAVNLDGPGSDEVRAYLIGSALAWLRDFHLDGLRLDAVHALADTRAPHFLEELAAAVEELAEALDRPLTLIAESDLNDPRLTTPRRAGGHGLHAQWNDEFHHALHVALTGERHGYYADFAGAPPAPAAGPPPAPAAGPLAALAAVLGRVWLHDGTWSSYRGRTHGRPVDLEHTPAHRFLGYLQTHDQVGNRATGDRISAGLTPDRLAAGAALVLCSPFTPMLFMGEEWGAATPWQYFTNHQDPDLGRAVSAGRRREFAALGWDEAAIPDPQEEATFVRSTLDWSEPTREPHRALLAWHRRLLALRRAEPALRDADLTAVRVDFDEQGRWLVLARGELRIAVNLGTEAVEAPLNGRVVETVAGWPGTDGPLGPDAPTTLPPGAVRVHRVR
jgi:maltooligosyltrehalose trehalohydrolase